MWLQEEGGSPPGAGSYYVGATKGWDEWELGRGSLPLRAQSPPPGALSAARSLCSASKPAPSVPEAVAHPALLPSPPGILCGQVPADWWVPDQLPARKGGKERMATTPHPLPRINWRLCRGKHSIDMQTGPYPHPSVQARWEILGENFIYPT